MITSIAADLPAHIAKYLAHDFKLLIDGRLVDAASGRTFDTISPVTETVIATVPDADETDVDAAVEAAERMRN